MVVRLEYHQKTSVVFIFFVCVFVHGMESHSKRNGVDEMSLAQCQKL